MKNFHLAVIVPLLLGFLAGCGGEPAETPATDTAADTGSATVGVSRDIAPGLNMVVTEAGSGETVAAGDIAVVHYTGWLHDPEAPDQRGDKFDSSKDRGQHFRFPLGAGRVIRGWDMGVEGMQVGEVRELTIAPDLAYGERGAGDVIPPGATLVFEVELAGIEGRDSGGTAPQ